MKQTQILYETKRAQQKGMTLPEWISEKLPRDFLIALIDNLIKTCDALDVKTDTLSAGNNTFSPDREYIELSDNKIHLLSAVHWAASRRSFD